MTTTRLKRVATLRAGGTPTVDDMAMWASDGGLPWVSIGDMSRSSIVLSTDRCVSDAGVASKRLPVGRTGTLLFAMYASVGALGVLGTKATWNQAILGIEPKADLADVRFISYWLQHLRQHFGSLVRSNTQDNLNAEQVGNFPFPARDYPSQRTIADFLDRETARTDALIAAKRRMIDVLRERRQVAIDLALVGSGQTVRVRHLVGRVTSGPRGWSDLVTDSGTMFLRITNVNARDIELDMRDVVFVDAPTGAERERTRVHEDDVLVSITADIGSVGVARAVHEGAAVSQHIALLTPTRCSGDWLAFSLVTSAAKAQLEASRYGGTKSQLSLDDVRDTEVGVVSAERSDEILRRLHQRLAAIQRASISVGKQIELLLEHRQALITAAVMGEMDVPGIAT